MGIQLRIGLVIAAAIAGGLGTVATLAATPNLMWLALLVGAVAGGVAGTLASPFRDNEEPRRFPAAAKAISAFVSGYFVSKVDRFLEVGFKNEQLIGTSVVPGLLLFGGGFLLFGLTAYMVREYLR